MNLRLNLILWGLVSLGLWVLAATLLMWAGLANAQTEGGLPVAQQQGSFSAQATPAVTASAYTSGLSEGGITSVANMVRPRGPGTGELRGILVTDNAGLTGGLTAILLSGTPSAASTFKDNNQVTIAKADQGLVIGIFALTCTLPTGLSSAPTLCVSGALTTRFRLTGTTCPSGQGQCFNGQVVLMAAASRTQVSTTDLQLTLYGQQD